MASITSRQNQVLSPERGPAAAMPAKTLAPEKLPIVLATLVRCPTCGGTRFHIDGTRRQPDESIHRYVDCLTADCGQRFLVIYEDRNE
jgi:hypothetical protein